MDEIFTRFSADKLQQLAERISVCLARLTDEQVWWRGASESNAVGNLVLHLHGNLGQWILHAAGGAPDHRHRDEEFSTTSGADRDQLRALLSERVTESARTIRGLSAQDLLRQVQVQNYRITVLEVVYHAVEHFAQHAGQIIYATKLLTGADLGFYAHLKAKHGSEPTP